MRRSFLQVFSWIAYIVALGGALYLGFKGVPFPAFFEVQLKTCERWDAAAIWSTFIFNFGFLLSVLAETDNPLNRITGFRRVCAVTFFVFALFVFLPLTGVIVFEINYPLRLLGKLGFYNDEISKKLLYLKLIIATFCCLALTDRIISTGRHRENKLFLRNFRYNDIPTLISFLILLSYFVILNNAGRFAFQQEQANVFNLLSGAIAFQMINSNMMLFIVFYNGIILGFILSSVQFISGQLQRIEDYLRSLF